MSMRVQRCKVCEKRFWSPDYYRNVCDCLSKLPVNDNDRNKLRYRIRLSGDRLSRAANKYLSLSAEYLERDRWAKKCAEGFTTIVANPVTRQSPCKSFESGRNCLPGMEAFAKQVTS